MKVFPTRLFYFQGQNADIDRRTVSGGTSVSGEEDLVLTDGGGRVTLEMNEADLDDPSVAAAWQAWDALLDGGGTPFIAPLGNARQQLMGDITTPIGGLPWWEESDFADSETLSALTADAALRATQISVSVDKLPAPVRAGIWLSIDHATRRHRAYRIAEVVSDNGSVAVLKIRPPLREASDEGAPVEFLDPKCTMHVDGTMSAPTTLGFAEGSVRFVEDFSESYA